MLSVIIPVYNVEKYIERCVNSVVNQTYGDLEIILVDDGSIDESGVICDSWEKRDNRIKVIHKQNGGLSDARNAGLDIAMGDYVSFVDSDDYIHPQMYDEMLKYFENEEVDIVCCKFKRVMEDATAKFQALEDEYNHIVLNSTEALLDLSITDVTACNKIYKRKVFREMRFVRGRYHEDEWLIHRSLFECNRIISIEAELYYYVMRKDSITHSFSEKKILDGVEAYIDRVKFVIEKEWKMVQKEVVASCLNHLIWAYIQNNNNVRMWHCRIIMYYRKVLAEAVMHRIPVSKQYVLFAISPQLYYLRT